MDKSTTQLLQLISTTTNIRNFLENNHLEFIDEHFTKMLEWYLDRSKLSKYQALTHAEIDLNYGYQIFNGRRKPNRNKVIQLALSLHLSLHETQLLLLSVDERQLHIRNRRDSIIMYAIEQTSCVHTLNEFLFENNEDLLIK